MTEAMPKVSVVCAWYNRADYIRDTIDSLLAQDYPNFDITVVNDGSPDPRVREILDSYTDPRLRVIHQQNTGFTRAIRRAIDESDGKYIAVQGAGDISLPGRLSAQVKEFQRCSRTVICSCWYTKLTKVQVIQCMPKRAKQGQLSGYSFSHGELMYDRRIYQKSGGYRDFFPVGQGSDLWMRMLRHGTASVLESVLYKQVIYDDGVTLNCEKVAIRRNLDKFRIKNEFYFRRYGIDLIDKHQQMAPFCHEVNTIRMKYTFPVINSLFSAIGMAGRYSLWRRLLRILNLGSERIWAAK